MFYADDTQIYLMFKTSERSHAAQKLSNCINELKQWLRWNDLVLNVEKTEIIHIASRYSNAEGLQNISLDDTSISVSNLARNLGVMVDSHLNLHAHITRVCQSSANALRMIGNVRKYLDKKQTEILIHAFVTSRINNCNSLYYAIPDYLIDRLQRLQNAAARLVTLSKKRDHITPVLYSLHWLPIK